jgi:hypothetical protein
VGEGRGAFSELGTSWHYWYFYEILCDRSGARIIPMQKLFATMLLVSLGGIAHAEKIFDISWTGTGGYSMTGQFSYADSLANTGVITGSKLDTFMITGFLNNTQVGSWNLTQGFAGFSFNFNFNTTTLLFPQGGISSGTTGQDWDVTTGGEHCPNPGFGFSSGSGSQGVCVNNGGFVGSTVIDNLTATPAPATAPEPFSAALCFTGLATLITIRRKRTVV